MERFLRQHRQMIDVARSIIDIVRKGGPTGPEELTRLRLRLSRSVTEHVSSELRFINLSGRAEALPPAMSSRYHHELLQWRHALMECHCAWPPARVFEEPEGFIAAFRPIAEALRQRVAWEEEELYPVVLGKHQSGAQERAAA